MCTAAPTPLWHTPVAWHGLSGVMAVQWNVAVLTVHLPLSKRPARIFSVAKSNKLEFCAPVWTVSSSGMIGFDFWCKHLCFIRFTLFLFFYFELHTFGK